MLSDELITLTSKLMLVKSKRDLVDVSGELNEIIERAIEAENAVSAERSDLDFSLSATLKFKLSETDKMAKTFKKEFIANGLSARIIKRPSGKNGVCYEIRYRRNGYNISASDTNLNEAKRKFLKQTEPGEIEKRQIKKAKSGLYLLDEIAEEWLAYKRGKVVPQTWNYYRNQYRKYISPALGEKPVPIIKTIDIDNQLSGKSGRLYEDLRSVFSQLFRYAVNSGIITHNPMAMIPFKKSERISHNALTTEQIRTLLNALERPQLKIYKQPFLVMLYFGLRPCELSDAHFENGFLIARNAKRKNGKIEYKKIPVSKMIQGKINFDSVVKPGLTNSMNRVFKRIMNDENATQYSLRHTFATVCQQYVRPDIVDIWMGDSPERLVGKIYTHFPDEFMREQMNTVIFTV